MQPSSDIQTNLTCWSSAKSAEVCYKLQRGIRQTLRVQVYYYHRYQWYECSTSCKFQSDKQDTFVQLYKCIIGCISVLVLDNQCIGGMFLHWVGHISTIVLVNSTSCIYDFQVRQGHQGQLTGGGRSMTGGFPGDPVIYFLRELRQFQQKFIFVVLLCHSNSVFLWNGEKAGDITFAMFSFSKVKDAKVC